MAQDWKLVWSDEFTDGIGSDWVYDIGNGTNGWGNNELEYYQTANATVENGVLVITARQESVGGLGYTSARMKTKGHASWQHGRIEARIAVPSVQGLWPAFWMLGSNFDSVGWPPCGEIDIMEHVNTESSVYGAIHWLDHNGTEATYKGSTTTTPTDYHVYAIEWDETSITWYVDGVQFHTVSIANGVNGTHELNNDFFILLNLAVGGNWPGFTIDNSALPASMYVDYVRVYQVGRSSGGCSDN
jgi:beta-glucanase (GH16 family)